MGDGVTLVTGGGGFIGRRLCETLTERGRSVRAVLLPGEPAPRAEQSIVADIRDAKAVEGLACADVDVVYHLAALANVPASVDDPAADFDVNVAGTFNLLQAVRPLKLKCFAFISTLSVLDPANALPLSETAFPGPRAPYPAAKLAGEAYCKAYFGSYGLPARIVRFPNVYGPGLKKLVVYELIRKILLDPTKLEILGDGSQIRDFLYVDDAVEAMIAIERDGRDGEIYHAGSGRPTTIGQLAELIIRQADLTDIPIVPAGESWKGDIPKWYADTTKIGALGFAPKVDLADGLKRTMQWIRETGIGEWQQRS